VKRPAEGPRAVGGPRRYEGSMIDRGVLPGPARDDGADEHDEPLEDLADLPPLDAEDPLGEDEASELDDPPAFADEDDLADARDDSEAADLDIGVEIDAPEAVADDLEDDPETDAGDDDVSFDDRATDEGEEEGIADDQELEIDDASGEDDGGAEGTGELPEDEVDERALPDLDDDEPDAAGDDPLAVALLAESEAGLLPWAAAPWVILPGAGAAVPCRAVAACAGRVAAAGEVLLFVEEGARAARRVAFGEGAVAVALEEDTLYAATARGQLLASRDGAAQAVTIGSWRAGLRPGDLAGSIELAATPGRFWIRAGGALLCATSPDRPPAVVRDRGVLAIAASGGVLSAVVLGPDGPSVERFRGDDEGWMEARLSGVAERIATPSPVPSPDAPRSLRLATAAGGLSVALSDGERVALSRDGGGSFHVEELGATPAIAFAGDEAGAPLLALVVAEGTFLVEVPAGGEASRVAEVPGADGGAEAEAALAWDASREVAWIASAAGLVAVGRARAH
jgi:hypothetical protein